MNDTEHLKHFCLRTIAGLIVIGVLVVILGLTSGCAMFGGDGLRLNVETPEKTVSLDVDYQIENGLKLIRTEAGEYEIELGSATTKDAEMGVVIELLRMMQAMMGQSYGVPIPPPATDADGG
jgi:hypothetical protein